MPILNFSPRMALFAYKPLEQDCRLNLLTGSVRSGKTWSMIPKILAGCRYPVRGWRVLTGVSKATIFNNVLNDLFDLIGEKNYSYNHQSGILRLFNSHWMVIGARDIGSEKFIRGMTVGLAVCDEISLMPEGFFKMLLTRMSPSGARLYGTTNTDSPLHWLKKDYLDRENIPQPDGLKGLIYVMHCTMDNNPNLSPEYVQSQKALYKGLFYQRFILGLWVLAQGGIFRDAWSEELKFTSPKLGETEEDTRHRANGMTIEPKTLKNPGGFVDRWVSVDCGVDHPQVYQEFYDDGTNIWITREWRWDSKLTMRQLTDAQYADKLIEFMGENKACQIIIPPEALSFKTECVSRGLWVTDADTDVNDGIDTVCSLMIKKKLRIHQDCTGVLTEITTYAWDPAAAKLGKEQPLKLNDDSCFVAGTKITTPTGQRNIEDLREGDKVITPLGECKVLSARPVEGKITIERRGLRGLGDHYVATKKGWTRLDGLRYDDELCEWKPLFSTALNSDDSQIRSTLHTRDISGQAYMMPKPEFRHFTRKSESSIMDRFQAVMMSITKMGTTGIMTSLILNYSPSANTKDAIQDLTTQPIWIGLGHSLRNGIVQKMEETGIGSIAGKYGKTPSRSRLPVSIAMRNLLLNATEKMLSSALTIASRLSGVNRMWTMFPQFARSVARCLCPTATNQLENVPDVPPRETVETVYLLKTEHGCYIANGILVSNCDTLRYGLHGKIPRWRIAA